MPQAVHFFIARDVHEGFELAKRFNWQALGAARFATPDALDIRLITMPRELHPSFPVDTRVYYHHSFLTGPDKEGDFQKRFNLFEKHAEELHYVMTELHEPEMPDAA